MINTREQLYNKYSQIISRCNSNFKNVKASCVDDIDTFVMHFISVYAVFESKAVWCKQCSSCYIFVVTGLTNGQSGS